MISQIFLVVENSFKHKIPIKYFETQEEAEKFLEQVTSQYSKRIQTVSNTTEYIAQAQDFLVIKALTLSQN